MQPPATLQFDPVAEKQVGPLRGSFSHVLLLHPGAASADWAAMSESADRYGELDGAETPVMIWAAARTATTSRVREMMRRIPSFISSSTLNGHSIRSISMYHE